MPTALSAPLHQLLAQLGPGDAARPAVDLQRLRAHLSDLGAAVARLSERLQHAWAGPAAAAATDRLDQLAAALHTLAGELEAMGGEVDAAAQQVSVARAELERLIADFEARATALEAQPGGSAALPGEAQHAQATAGQLVDGLRGALAGGAQAMPAAGGFGAVPGVGGFGPGPTAWGGSGPGEAVLAAHRDTPRPDAAEFGAGVAVRLPDGTSVQAPNAVAAGAVRHALTQLGVPYQWGGTTAGVGLDCSGLTQWAYREAGLTLPRLAQEQDIGAAVDAGSLRPGDLAVWDGHVAMIVGNGTMIEAGDPVQLSPIRTTNAGQGFQGFWRPTA
ncbi:C40 family peptidase [Mycolicibacterium bacteremicum]|uniref:Glycoside hydrolase n=1 Tax=Mycolicibacterium bacteremicum TaxID=564198 RepID=A0A1W9YWA6_MYCBA|nr:C40 family peptidase [Mycolicibacterium bacteremicum]MCV7431507.1 C40 family peptidase [Mycolicibacterium bacteremicum]ORA04341.1 glycoside hydrolase [Mycolicibacterium bacteremicum]